MSGIMSMFSNLMGGTPAQPQAPAPTQNSQPTTPGNIPQGAAATGVSNPNTAPNGTVPAMPPENNAAGGTPFDQFADLWKNTQPNGAQDQSVFGQVDPRKFMEAAGKIDFAKVVTPDQLQAISQGGENAVQAFAAALNSVAQTTYAQSAFASTKIVDNALQRAKTNWMAELPQHIKQHTVKENLRAENPVFSNPAVQPVISALETQLAVKFPQASAGELTQMARTYVEALGSAFTPKQAAATADKKDDQDWSTYLN